MIRVHWWNRWIGSPSRRGIWKGRRLAKEIAKGIQGK